MTQDIDDFKIKISEVKQPPCLLMVEVLGLMEVCQVLVISEDLDEERGSVEVMPLGLQGADDCEEFSVIDVAVLLSWDEQLGKVGAGVPIAIGISLKKNSVRGIFRVISGNGERLGEVWKVEDRA